MIDSRTKPLSREAIRNMTPYIREMFGVNSNDPFPVLLALDKLCSLIENTNYQIVEDDFLPGDVFAWCYQNCDGGYTIEIKQTVYDGACYNNNKAFLCFICHEICHVILFELGYTPIVTRSVGTEKIPVYCSVEWQAKALCGELTIPYDATKGMKVNEIMKKYHVTEASAKYRVKQDK